jgi:hypothetical protein
MFTEEPMPVKKSIDSWFWILAVRQDWDVAKRYRTTLLPKQHNPGTITCAGRRVSKS